MSNSLQPHGLQHARLPCPSPAPGACSNSCPSSWWRHPIISSSVIPFSSCLQSFPASGSFLRSQFFASGGQSIGASTSAIPLWLHLKIESLCFRDTDWNVYGWKDMKSGLCFKITYQWWMQVEWGTYLKQDWPWVDNCWNWVMGTWGCHHAILPTVYVWNVLL